MNRYRIVKAFLPWDAPIPRVVHRRISGTDHEGDIIVMLPRINKDHPGYRAAAVWLAQPGRRLYDEFYWVFHE